MLVLGREKRLPAILPIGASEVVIALGIVTVEIRRHLTEVSQLFPRICLQDQPEAASEETDV